MYFFVVDGVIFDVGYVFFFDRLVFLIVYGRCFVEGCVRFVIDYLFFLWLVMVWVRENWFFWCCLRVVIVVVFLCCLLVDVS